MVIKHMIPWLGILMQFLIYWLSKVTFNLLTLFFWNAMIFSSVIDHVIGSGFPNAIPCLVIVESYL